MRAVRISGVVVGVIIASAGGALAQDAGVGTVTIRSSSKLVVVDVVADSGGRAATGLAKERFRVTEDGKDRPIVSFEEHHVADAAAMKVARVMPPHVYSNSSVATAGVVNVLLIDGLNTAVTDQMQSRKQMLNYAAKLQGTAPMAIFTLGTGVRQLMGFTDAPGALEAALNGKGSVNTPSVLADASNAHVGLANQMVYMKGPDGPDAAASQFEADTASYQMDARVELTLSAMQELARYLSLLPGRKNLLWLSGSFPIALDADNSLADSMRASRSYADDVRRTDALLAEARVAVYPVDIRGAMNLPAFDPSYQIGTQATTPVSGPGSAVETSNKQFMTSQRSEHATMEDVAHDTGGRAFLNTNDLAGAMRKAIEDGSSYYTISYAPVSAKPDGGYHKIRVSVTGGDYQLEYRRGYFADTADEDSGKAAKKKDKQAPDAGLLAMRATVAHGAPPAGQVIFDARVLAVSDAGMAAAMQQDAKMAEQINGAPGGEMEMKSAPHERYIVDMRINVSSLRFATGADGARSAQMEMTMVGYDKDGKNVNLVDKAFPLQLTEAEYKQLIAPGFALRTVIDLPKGAGSEHGWLRIAVRQAGVERLGSIEVPVG
jgi:VWFA-related protein